MRGRRKEEGTQAVAPIPVRGLGREERRLVGLVSSQEQELTGILNSARFWAFILAYGHPLLRVRDDLLDKFERGIRRTRGQDDNRWFSGVRDVTQMSLAKGNRSLFSEIRQWEEQAGSLFKEYGKFEAGRMWTAFHGGQLAERVKLDVRLQAAGLAESNVDGWGYQLVQLGQSVVVGDRVMADVVVMPNGKDSLEKLVVPRHVNEVLSEEIEVVTTAVGEAVVTGVRQWEQPSPLVVFGREITSKEEELLGALFDGAARLQFNLQQGALVAVEDTWLTTQRVLTGYRSFDQTSEVVTRVMRTTDGHVYSSRELDNGDHYGHVNEYTAETKKQRMGTEHWAHQTVVQGRKNVPLDVIKMVQDERLRPDMVMRGHPRYAGAEWSGREEVRMGEVVQTVLEAMEVQFKKDLQAVLVAAKEVALFNAGEWGKSYPGLDSEKLVWLSLLYHMTWPDTMVLYFQKYFYQSVIDFLKDRRGETSSGAIAKVR